VKWNQYERRTRSCPPLWGGSARSAGVGVVDPLKDPHPPTPPHKGEGVHRVRGLIVLQAQR